MPKGQRGGSETVAAATVRAAAAYVAAFAGAAGSATAVVVDSLSVAEHLLGSTFSNSSIPLSLPIQLLLRLLRRVLRHGLALTPTMIRCWLPAGSLGCPHSGITSTINTL